MRFLFLFLFLIPRAAICQVEPFKDKDYYKKEIEKNIMRGTITFLLQKEMRLLFCYEREIKKPFTVVLKAGPSVLASDVSSDNEIELAAMASGELRYYFNLRRRIKQEKATRNFSAAYFSLEPFVISKPLILFNEPGDKETSRRAGVYINIGCQQQVKRSYISAFFGTRFFGRIYSDASEGFDVIQGGITIGRIF